MLALLEEVAEFLDPYVDVRDGEDGPLPNKAMLLKAEVDIEIDRLKSPRSSVAEELALADQFEHALGDVAITTLVRKHRDVLLRALRGTTPSSVTLDRLNASAHGPSRLEFSELLNYRTECKAALQHAAMTMKALAAGKPVRDLDEQLSWIDHLLSQSPATSEPARDADPVAALIKERDEWT
jgi:hypothetical protein